MKHSYRQTLRACYVGYVTQAVVNNLAPLLFVIFQDSFGLSFEQVGRLVLINFGVQILADIFSVKYVDRMGFRAAGVLAHALCTVGLVLLAVLPQLFPGAYISLVFPVVLYALGGGLLEVIVSPIVDALPGDDKKGAMSLLHSFYSWGQVAVVLVSTLLLQAFGQAFWPILPVLWAALPLFNLINFCRVPLPAPLPKEKRMPVRTLLRSRFFRLGLLLMLCAGAAELSMSQWSSLFAEEGLKIPKTMGDLLGPCLFAVFMGAGRALYGHFGKNIDLRRALVFCGALCVACYLTTVFSPWPLLSLLGCALSGLAVSLMWPGTFSLSAEKFPSGGTAMFGIFAIFGDLGGAFGPWLAGCVSDWAQRSQALTSLPIFSGLNSVQLGLKSGLLAAAIFPAVLLVGVLLFRRKKEKKPA